MKVYELRWEHDEGFYPVAVFATKDEADRVAAGAKPFLENPDDPNGCFTVTERDVLWATGEWTRKDYIDALGEWDIEDYFLPEPDEEEE